MKKSVLFILLAILLAAAVVIGVLAGQKANVSKDYAAYQDEMTKKYDTLNEELTAGKADAAALKTDLEAAQTALAEKQAALEAAQAELNAAKKAQEAAAATAAALLKETKDAAAKELEAVKKAAKESEDGVFVQVEGVHHVKEASVGKLLRGYQLMNRTTNVPQPGFLLVYGCSFNKTIHVALVYDVKDLGDGKYRITTLEGNMASRVKMYIHDYDMNAEVNTNKKTSTNLSEVPEDEREIPASDCVDYTVVTAKPSNSTSGKYAYYVNCFLMPYVPGEEAE